MPHSTDWEPGGIVWRFWGDVTAEELLELNRSLFADARFPDLRYQICDFVKAEAIVATTEDVRHLAKLDVAASEMNPHVRIAIVSSRALIKGYTNMYAGYATDSPWDTQIFDTMDDARAWVAEPRRDAYA